MRTYGKNFLFKKTASYKERQVRLATEWDIRLDASATLSAQNIINNIVLALDDIQYVFVSGVESPNKREHQHTNRKLGWSDENHVHIALVLLAPKQRTDVLKLLRGPRKHGDEYAAPRNGKFSYAGWIIHHAKPS
ncbi:hypothetical protein AM587_10003078 [Phytophthora nicotianae]|uniref:Uncharacterized protein n=1 Tax=Phytophthora nicotianae TaxID=4792 RepID=A0A0W8CFU4_PHYNI|nr:hypothetical protein AM587_10003078 [Phytophthora nicotianae]